MTSGREFKSHRAKLPNFEPGKSLYDLGTFSGRLKHFLRVLDPRTLFISAQYLKRCENMVKDLAGGELLQKSRVVGLPVNPRSVHSPFVKIHDSNTVPDGCICAC